MLFNAYIVIAGLCGSLAGCASLDSPPLPAAQQGQPGKAIDQVARSIQENAEGDDTMGYDGPEQTFEVYMTAMEDEDGHLSDPGTVTLTKSDRLY